MQISLQSPGRKRCFLAASLLAAMAMVGLATTELLADWCFNRPGRENLERAVRLRPDNAEYFDRLGRHYTLIEFSPGQAIAAYQTAVALNPYKSRYWLHLADLYQEISDTPHQRVALEHALAADPHNPEVAWQAANLFAGTDSLRSLEQLRTVLEGVPQLAPAALALAWRLSPDIDRDLKQVIPADARTYCEFLDLLMVRKESIAAQKTWNALASLQQPIERQTVFDYIRYLISQSQVDQAAAVWRQAGSLSGLAAYQPSQQNLIVNGDFNLDVLNGGFDWLYNKSKDVSLALDPIEVFLGRRSLKIKFDSRSLDDAGIRQLIPVKANTSYIFSGYFKATDIEGAGGPRIVLQDGYNETLCFASEPMKDTEDWKQISGNFSTGPQSKLLVLRVQRLPAGSPIRGELWIDNLSLRPASE
ncbi:MAG TPA: carbohydrate binding domain-containing protein [Terriglobales bacterium]|nr:carbohydrate binding domain-containing protein [Terriglobales bacterium]